MCDEEVVIVVVDALFVVLVPHKAIAFWTLPHIHTDAWNRKL